MSIILNKYVRERIFNTSEHRMHMPETSKYVGIMPAAGKGRRLSSFMYPKELSLIPYSNFFEKKAHKGVRAVCEFALDCLRNAGIPLAYVVISDHKFGIINFLGNGDRFGLNLAYLYQNELGGLPHAIDCAYSFVKSRSVALVLPDTIIYPEIALSNMLSFFDSKKGDVILGLFNSDDPQNFCQVLYDKKFRVVELRDKDQIIKTNKVWGLVAWRPCFNEFLHNYLKKNPGERSEISLSEVLEEALKDGVNMLIYSFDKFICIGINSPNKLYDAAKLFSPNRT